MRVIIMRICAYIQCVCQYIHYVCVCVYVGVFVCIDACVFMCPVVVKYEDMRMCEKECVGV